MKKTYEEANVEVIVMNEGDIITASKPGDEQIED